jgi:hypothetical protein
MDFCFRGSSGHCARRPEQAADDRQHPRDLPVGRPVAAGPLRPAGRNRCAPVRRADQSGQGPRRASIEYIKVGKLRALAVTSLQRSAILPDVPTVDEFVPGYEASQSYGLGVPRGTPVELVHKLNREIDAALADPKIKERFAALGATVIPGSPADYGKFIAEETEKWAKVIRATNIKAE